MADKKQHIDITKMDMAELMDGRHITKGNITLSYEPLAKMVPDTS